MDLKSGYPYSLIKNGLVAGYPALGKNTKADVVVLGAGISGALVAWHLVQKGVDCMVLDARSVGLGSTCASSSLLLYEIDIPLHRLIEMSGLHNATRAYQLSHRSVNSLVSLANKIGFTDIQKKESIYYAAKARDKILLGKEFTARKKIGINVRLLDAKQLMKETGIQAPAAILSSVAAQTDAYLLTHALLSDCSKKGVPVYDRTPVVKIDHNKQGIDLTTETGFKIKAKKVVYATGYESVNYIDDPIVKLKSTWAVVSETYPLHQQFWKKERLIWNTADPYLYIRTTPDHRILVGGRDENFYSPSRRDKMTDKKTGLLVKDFKKLFPTQDFKPEFSWTGTFGYTRDGLPYIGEYKKLKNSYFALGFGGNGITFSLIAAEMIRDMVTGKKNPDSGLFSFDR